MQKNKSCKSKPLSPTGCGGTSTVDALWWLVWDSKGWMDRWIHAYVWCENVCVPACEILLMSLPQVPSYLLISLAFSSAFKEPSFPCRYSYYWTFYRLMYIFTFRLVRLNLHVLISYSWAYIFYWTRWSAAHVPLCYKNTHIHTCYIFLLFSYFSIESQVHLSLQYMQYKAYGWLKLKPLL